MPSKNAASCAQKKRWKQHRKEKALRELEATNSNPPAQASQTPIVIDSTSDSENNDSSTQGHTKQHDKAKAPCNSEGNLQTQIVIDSTSDLDFSNLSTRDNLPPPPPSFLDDPSPVYWLPIDLDYEDEENELDPSGTHLYINANIADSSDDEECDQVLINNALYPVFTRPCPSKPRLGKRRDRSGAVIKGYKKPRVQADSKKLKPAIIPKQTKFSRKQKAINAVGKNTSFMSNWLGQGQPTSSSMTSTSLNSHNNNQHNSNTLSDSSNNFESDSSNEFESDLSSDSESTASDKSNEANSPNTFSPDLAAAHDKWIDECVTRYCNTTKPPSGPERSKKAAQDCFDELQASILTVSNKYKEEAHNNPLFEYPS